MFAACGKENTETLTTSGFTLTTECHTAPGAEKTSVQDNTVQWTGSDETVRLNGVEYAVAVKHDTAYVDAAALASVAPVYGYYACGTIANEQSTTPTVTVPSSYACSMRDARQVIALPMAAYNSRPSNGIRFRHVTAAIKVISLSAAAAA